MKHILIILTSILLLSSPVIGQSGSYDNITTSATSADVISYIDTVTAAGLYWYRVTATNSIGDSIPSKVITVDVE